MELTEKQCTNLEWSLYTQVVELKQQNKELREGLEKIKQDEAFKGVITHGYPTYINKLLEDG